MARSAVAIVLLCLGSAKTATTAPTTPPRDVKRTAGGEAKEAAARITSTRVSTDDEEHVYSQLNRAVVRLEHIEWTRYEGVLRSKAQNKPDGTAFFVRSGDELFLVTARHVAQREYDIRARTQTLKDGTGQLEVILLRVPRKRWTFHPTGGDKEHRFVDVAAMKLPWPEGRSIKYFRYEPPGSSKHELNQLPSEDPVPTTSVALAGFPADFGIHLPRQKPFIRSGIISIAGKGYVGKVDNLFPADRCFIIGEPGFPGYSGGPVISQWFSGPKIALLGVASAHNPRMLFSLAEPVSRVREVLDLAKKQSAEGFQCWSLLKMK